MRIQPMASWTLCLLWLTAIGLGSSSFGSGGDAAFAGPDLYEFCEKKRITYFIRLPSNSNLKSRILHAPRGAAGRPPKGGVQVRVVELRYQAEK